MSSHQFNDQRMKAMLPRDVWERFRDARARMRRYRYLALNRVAP